MASITALLEPLIGKDSVKTGLVAHRSKHFKPISFYYPIPIMSVGSDPASAPVEDNQITK